MKKAFTLLEVNLAMFVMAIGVLSMIALYPLGFRESDQSREDVAAAACCESVMNSLAAALSSTNILWSDWAKVARENDGYGKTFPSGGWDEYFQPGTYFGVPKSAEKMRGLAKSTYESVISATKPPANVVEKPWWPNDGLAYGLVVSFTGTRCAIAVRASRRPAMLLAQPLFFTEVNFQGKFEEGK